MRLVWTKVARPPTGVDESGAKNNFQYVHLFEALDDKAVNWPKNAAAADGKAVKIDASGRGQSRAYWKDYKGYLDFHTRMNSDTDNLRKLVKMYVHEKFTKSKGRTIKVVHKGMEFTCAYADAKHDE